MSDTEDLIFIKSLDEDCKNNACPTRQAFRIARASNLIPDPESKMEPGEKRLEAERILRDFQQQSIDCNFNDCMSNYFGYSINKEQEEVLKFIHKSTPGWLAGNLTGVLISRLNNGKITNKDFGMSMSIIFEQLNPRSTNEKGAGNANRRSQFLMADLKPIDKK